jgi:hypothetical protein
MASPESRATDAVRDTSASDSTPADGLPLFPPPSAGAVSRRVDADEGTLLAILGAWSLASVLGGAVLWAAGHRGGRPALAAFGRQNLAWGAVDGAIAAWGWRGRRRRHVVLAGAGPAMRDVQAGQHARRMRRLTGANAVLDVGYVGAGAWLATRAPRRRADGWAVVLQGLFLLLLDARYVLRFANDTQRRFHPEG